MSIKGGYKLIDLRETSLTIDGDEVKIDGLYSEIESNYRKPCVITGLVIDEVERADRYINFRHDDNYYIGVIGFNDSYLNLMIKITDEDMVSIFNL